MTTLALFAVGRRGVQLAGRIQLQLGGDVYAPGRFLRGPESAEDLPLPNPPLREITDLPRSAGRPHPLPEGEGAKPYGPEGIKAALADAFGRYQGLVLILPVGAAVRLLAPLLQDKRMDPAVVALDEAGTHAIALLSGHAGGANHLARQVAAAVGGQPVITTAAEVLGSLALDLLGKEWGWEIESDADVTRASAAVIDGEPIGIYQDAGEEGWWRNAPASFRRYASMAELLVAPVAARLVISDRMWNTLTPPNPQSRIPNPQRPTPDPQPPTPIVTYRPKTLVVGIGCVRGATPDELDDLVQRTFLAHGLAPGSVRELATIDRKRDEEGIIKLGARHGWPMRYFSAEALAELVPPSGRSAAVEQAVGTPGVCEPAALRAARAETLVVPKSQTRRATIAVARVPLATTRGTLAVVGLGPGAPEEITERGRRALEAAETIVGYEGYLDLVRPWLGPKAYHGSPIGEEVERCRLAIALARSGHHVALVSSGDAGVYGTAGIVFELLEADGLAAEAAAVEVVPGVSAAHAAGALLGAPLMSDYAAISLSDLMTSWSAIERRLEAAAAADLVVVLYNPASGRRQTQLAHAQTILLSHRSPATPVGLVRNASRPGQTVTVTDLQHLLEHPVDMLTTVVVGNSATVRVGDRLVTRRGTRSLRPTRQSWAAAEPPT